MSLQSDCSTIASLSSGTAYETLGACHLLWARILTFSVALILVAGCVSTPAADPSSTPVATTPPPTQASPTPTGTAIALASPTEPPPAFTAAPSATPMRPTLTATPLSPTSSPTTTPTNAATRTPDPTDSGSACNADEILENLRSAVGYDDYELSYTAVPGMSSLIIWFIDPEINPSASKEELSENGSLATQHGIEMAHRLLKADPCVAQLFTHIDAIVVDSRYNGWFSGAMAVGSFPSSDVLTADDRRSIEDGINPKFVESQAPVPVASPSPGSCTWTEARQRIPRHFGVNNNMAFYMVTDPNGATAYAQWSVIASSGSEDLHDSMTLALNMAAVMNVWSELRCADPPLDMLAVYVVDSSGNIKMMATLPGEALRASDPTNAAQQLQYRVFD